MLRGGFSVWALVDEALWDFKLHQAQLSDCNCWSFIAKSGVVSAKKMDPFQTSEGLMQSAQLFEELDTLTTHLMDKDSPAP